MSDLSEKQEEVKESIMEVCREYEGEISVLEMAEVFQVFSYEFNIQAYANTKSIDPEKFEEIKKGGLAE